MDLLLQFLSNTGYFLADYRHVIMIVVGSVFIYLGTAKKFEPLLLVPIGFGILIGNIPFFKGFGLGIYESNSVLHYLYFGVTTGLYHGTQENKLPMGRLGSLSPARLLPIASLTAVTASS